MKAEREQRTVLLRIQNGKKPDQIISVVHDSENHCYETEGLGGLFGVKEIRVDSNDGMEILNEFAAVISFLLETMSTAQDLNLPYGYQDHFAYQGTNYTLYQQGNYRLLKRAE